MRRRLLVVGANPHRERAFHALTASGVEIVLAAGSATSPYEHVVDEVHIIEDRDSKAPNMAALLSLAQSCEGVITLADGSQVTAELVASAMGWPTPGALAARMSRDKRLQRSRSGELGLPTPKWLDGAASRSEIAEFLSACGGICVVKPADAAASAGVTIVRSESEAAGALAIAKAFSPTQATILEEYISGPEVSVEVVVSGGAVMATSVTQKASGGATGCVEVQHLVVTDPPYRREATAVAKQTVAAWQVGSGILHLEVRIADRGPVLIEGAVRAAGDFIPELVEAVHGLNLYSAQAAVALGQAITQKAPIATAAGVKFLIAEGVVGRSALPVEVIPPGSPVRIAHQLMPPGTRLRPTTANWLRAGYAVGWGNDSVLLLRALEEAIDRLAAAMRVSAVP